MMPAVEVEVTITTTQPIHFGRGQKDHLKFERALRPKAGEDARQFIRRCNYQFVTMLEDFFKFMDGDEEDA